MRTMKNVTCLVCRCLDMHRIVRASEPVSWFSRSTCCMKKQNWTQINNMVALLYPLMDKISCDLSFWPSLLLSRPPLYPGLQMRQKIPGMVPQLCLCPWPTVLQDLQTTGLGPGLSQNSWTASRQVTCATRTLTAALVTGWCANVLWARRRKPCWTTTGSARLPWKCCWLVLCMTAAARGAWKRSSSVCKTIGPSTWDSLKVGGIWFYESLPQKVYISLSTFQNNTSWSPIVLSKTTNVPVHANFLLILSYFFLIILDQFIWI